MTGWIQVEYAVDWGDVKSAQSLAKGYAEEIEKIVLINEKPVINGLNIYGIAWTNSFIVEAGFTKTEGVTEIMVQEAKAKFTSLLGEKLSKEQNLKITQSRYVNIGESFGAYIKKSGYITLTLAIIMIAIYIAYAFRGSIPGMASWPFAVVTGLSLVHDIIIAFGLYVATSYFFPEFKIDTFFFTALLTILGYSINDTIVVMDRIRSNLGEWEGKKMSLAHIIDKSIHDTMSRSLLTSSTIVIVLIALFIFGPETLKGFTLVLLFGTIIGTYSSVCIASPLLLDITKWKK
jgi:preprotein translocase SecF subunit